MDIVYIHEQVTAQCMAGLLFCEIRGHRCTCLSNEGDQNMFSEGKTGWDRGFSPFDYGPVAPGFPDSKSNVFP